MPGTIQSKIALLANFIIELPPVCSAKRVSFQRYVANGKDCLVWSAELNFLIGRAEFLNSVFCGRPVRSLLPAFDAASG
jgi:hypothetical protein